MKLCEIPEQVPVLGVLFFVRC